MSHATLGRNKKDSAAYVSHSNKIVLRADEGKLIVLRSNPLFQIIFFIVFLAIILTLTLALSLEWQVITILFSVWGGTGIIALTAVLTDRLIFNSEGFFYRKRIFKTYIERWTNLTSPPETEMVIGPEGNKWATINFPVSDGVLAASVASFKIKDMKKQELRLELLGRIAQQYYKRATKS